MLIVQIVTVTVSILIVYVMFRKYWHVNLKENPYYILKEGQLRKRNTPPSPPGRSILGNVLDFTPDQLHDYFMTWQSKLGYIVAYNFVGRYVNVISHPSLAKGISDRESFTISRTTQAVFGHFFPNAILVLEGERWRVCRRVLHSALTRMRVKKWLPQAMLSLDIFTKPVLEMACDNRFTELDTNTVDLRDGSVNIEASISNAILDAFTRFGYGLDNPAEDAVCRSLRENVLILGAAFNQRFFSVSKLLWHIPTSQNRRINRAYKEILEFIRDLIAKRQPALIADPDCARDNITDRFILASLEEKLSTAEVEENLAMLIFGGFDTTANTICTCLRLISRHPHAQTEISRQLTTWSAMGSDIKSLKKDVPYLEWCILESQRLYPTIALFSRTALTTSTIDGYDFKIGSNFVIHNQALGRTAKEWRFKEEVIDPTTFRPERWADETLYPRVTKANAFNPFGAGGRLCPGMNLAQDETRMVLANLLKDYYFEASEHHPLEFKLQLGLGSRNGTWVKVRKNNI